MAARRVNAIVEGVVQGVFFRACTRDEGERLALAGWVRNQPNGKVETEFEGEAREVERMINWLHQGSPMSRVSKVTVIELTPSCTERDFTITY